MIRESLYQVIRRPHVSEKTARVGADSNQYVFEVEKSASKTDIRQAIEALFEVQVRDVTVVNIPAKRKTFRGRPGARNAWKKAYVRLADGQSIDLVDGEQA
ncbi:MAG: 50S ribosomal protein L23 [Gammaproteobacteria bacterium]|jgi:large subunit ribosomal protein L23|nr:50S ribosomal protein L23 [Gammaproteobacteria bacterium]